MTDNAISSSLPEDPFDPARLRLSQDFASQIGVKKLLITVPVRKPDRQTFVRTHPDPAYRLETAVIELKEDRSTYLVAPELWGELGGDIFPVVLITAVSRQGDVLLWPIRLPDSDGRYNEWHRSQLEAAERAKTAWIKMAAKTSLGAYEVCEATGNIPEPEWPSIGFRDILHLAFKDRFISSSDHPVCRHLRGEQ